MNAPVSEGAKTSVFDLGVVLNDVNKIRLAVGIGEGKLPELPKGVKGDPQQCVLARALSNGWGVKVDDILQLSNSDLPDFDWNKTVDTLCDLGFEASLYQDEYYCSCGDPDCRESEVSYICIELTPEMDNLIHDFDDGLIPDLVLNN